MAKSYIVSMKVRLQRFCNVCHKPVDKIKKGMCKNYRDAKAAMHKVVCDIDFNEYFKKFDYNEKEGLGAYPFKEK